MKNDVKATATDAGAPTFVKRVGKSTYTVTIHFSPTSKETMGDKIMRMIRNEVSQGKKM